MAGNEFIGYLVVGLTALIGLFAAIIKPITNLNSNLTKLNLNFEHMNEKDKKRDESIEEMEDEIKLINKVQFEHKACLKNHETRIDIIEKKIDRKDGKL